MREKNSLRSCLRVIVEDRVEFFFGVCAGEMLVDVDVESVATVQKGIRDVPVVHL